MRATTMLPAVAMTAVSMVLTLAVVVMWLGSAVPEPVALVVGLGIDGGWLATLAYERRLAAQGDHNRTVTGIGWAFGLGATGVLVTHALTGEESAAWLAVAWLPLAAKALWVVHSLWERTALTPDALEAIQGIQQEARDEAAVARARLRAEAGTEETRLAAVTEAGARVADVQAKTAETLSQAWATLEKARKGEGTGRALTSVTAPVTPGVTPRWELPIWGPTQPVPALEAAPALTDEALDALVVQIRDSEVPPLSYRETASRFRAAGHAASEVRLRAAWKRVTTAAPDGPHVGSEGRS
ncbi:protein spdB [Streptomyces daliensis]|uniref:Protein spdB n=1 Tax=Streptomyces daliensis TaxID=299421 RepID=A0A8T4IY69_9ACTN|nr:protein spdB [Streptomyces daliensis]